MALDLATLRTMRDALETALFTGQRRVGYGDKSVEYRSLEEMRGTLDALNRKIDALAGATGPRQIRIYTGDGYGDETL